jgi:hypothetical protein
LNNATSVALIIGIALAGSPASAGAQAVSPYLFGQNYWMEQGTEGGRPGYLQLLWPKVAESGVRLIRIGGNGYNQSFPERPHLLSMIAAVRSVGAEPLLQVPRAFSAEQAAELVLSLNGSASTRVGFWSIGNEPLLREPDIIEQVHDYLMRIAPAMKKADPTIKIFVFDECEMRAPAFEALCGGRLDITGKNPDGTWIVDGFTFHRYPNGKEYTRDDVVIRGPADIRKQAGELVAMMERADRKHARTGDARLQWALTELNVTWANPDRRVEGIGNPSFLGGQFVAEVFGIGMQLGAFTVAPWCISETDHAETDFGYLGLPPEFYPRSSYYHVQMMARHMRGEFLPSTTSEAGVKSIATRDGAGLSVMLLNELQDRDLDYDLALSKGATSTKPLRVEVDAGLPATLAGHLPRETTTLLVFDRDGQPQWQYTYGQQQNVENQAPEVLPLSGRANAASTTPAAVTASALAQPPLPSFVPAGYAGAPFGDARNPKAPQRIPGRLQCELYDVGGSGVAFSDSDGKNSGSGALNPIDGSYLHGFRAGEAVDISYTKDQGAPPPDFSEFDRVTPEHNSLYLGWTEPGEWVNYTVAVEKAGPYTVDVMYTSNGEGRFGLYVDDALRGTITLPTTHDDKDPVAWRQWHHWNKVVGALDLDLKAGLHLVRIALLAGNTNLDYLEFRRKSRP